jgi:hypothetical protein
MEIEMRREQAAREREELGVTKDAYDFTKPTENANSSEDSTPRLAPAPQATSYPSRLTDRFERNIIKHIVRHGGETFTFSYFNNDEKKEENVDIRVIDFIYNELNADELTLQHPLYARMYNLALDASADPSVAWDSVKFFSNRFDDPEVQQTAINLLQDRYDALGIAQNIERIDILVPRSILELKNCILEQQIDALTQELRVTADLSKCNELMQQLAEKIKIKKSFDKELGERVIIPGRR